MIKISLIRELTSIKLILLVLAYFPLKERQQASKIDERQ